jgi:hypothetical protein
MNWQNEATKKEGALKSNPFAGFKAYEDVAPQSGLMSDEVAEGEGQAPGGEANVGPTYS